MTNLNSILKRRDISLPTKVHLSQTCGFSSSHVWMWELDHKEVWAPKNWCFWNAVLEKTLESPLDSKEIKPVNLRGNQLWIFIGRTDAEAEALIMWPPDVKSWLIGKDPDAGKDWRQKEKGMTEDEMVVWHHWHNGDGFGWTPGLVIDREAWRAAVHGVAKSRTRLSDWTELNWILPWTGIGYLKIRKQLASKHFDIYYRGTGVLVLEYRKKCASEIQTDTWNIQKYHYGIHIYYV